jgi:hypothetical protein
VRARELEEYESALVRIAASVRSSDRRLGLANLFWLAHSREVALACARSRRSCREAEGQVPVHPLLAQFYRRVDQSVRRSSSAGPRVLGVDPAARRTPA